MTRKKTFTNFFVLIQIFLSKIRIKLKFYLKKPETSDEWQRYTLQVPDSRYEKIYSK